MTKKPRMPALFYGHGSPMNALEDNIYTQVWQSFGQRFARPSAILAISAHWLTEGVAVTAMEAPRTIHDFGGFPQALFDIHYPAPGDPQLAQRVADLLAPMAVTLNHSWGLDHGTWSVLRKTYPQADIPIVQLSIDMTQPPAYHFALGQKLSALRDEGVMVIASGNIVHNLRRLDLRLLDQGYDWAHRFNAQMRQAILESDMEFVMNYEALGSDAVLSVPTPEHFLPLLYILGCKRDDDDVEIVMDGMQMGSISMLSVVVS